MEDIRKSKKDSTPWNKQIKTLVIVLIVLLLLLGTAVGWLFVRDHQQESRINHLQDNVNFWKSQCIKRFSKTPFENLEKRDQNKREIIGSGSTSDLVKLGLRGPPGPPGRDGRDGRDAVNFVTVDRHVKTTVAVEVKQEMAKVRLAAKDIPTVTGATYIRWGRTDCPESSRLISQGIAAGSFYTTSGGGSEFLCLVDDPEYQQSSKTPPGIYISSLSAVEYHNLVPGMFNGKSLADDNVPCAYCQANIPSGRPQKLMLPGRLRCPTMWTTEYQGSLMSEPTASGHYRTSYICVDMNAEGIPGQAHDSRGAHVSHVIANCDSGRGNMGACPPYKNKIPISCVVCSR